MKRLLTILLLAACTGFAIVPNGIGLRNAATVARATATGGGSAPSYANSGGTGSRGSIITQSQSFGYTMVGAGVLIDGNTGNTGCYFNSVANGDWFQFDFGSGKIINEVKWYQQTTATHGTWKIQGSNDNSTFTDIGSSFTFGGATTQTITEISGNSTAYRYYRFTKVSGSVVGIWLYEVEFQIGTP